MATLNVGGTQQFVFFGTGGDLLPGTDKATTYHLLGVQDNGRFAFIMKGGMRYVPCQGTPHLRRLH